MTGGIQSLFAFPVFPAFPAFILSPQPFPYNRERKRSAVNKPRIPHTHKYRHP